MADVKISQLPTATVVNANDILVLNQGGATKTATQSLVVAGLATTSQVAAITPASIGALATSAASGFATTAQLNAITPASIGAVATSDIIAISKGGTGSTSAPAALTALGAMSATQVAGGDLSGNLPNPTVAKIQGNAVSGAAPSNGQVLQWNGTAWGPGEIPSGGSGGGGQAFFFNYNTAADAPTTGLPTTPTLVKELGRVSDTTGTSYTSGNLSTTGYDLVVHFVTDVLDPNITAIPAGLFDFNFWASSTGTTSNQTIVQLKVFKYDGTTATLLATSDDISIYDPTVTAQYIASVVLPQTTVTLSDRLYIQFLGKATQNNKTITFNFGATRPAHVHTTIPSVGGSGLVKVINGVFQSPASLLVNADVASNAAISLSKLAMSEVSVASGSGLTGGGDLSTSRTLSLAALSPDPTGNYGSSAQIPVLTVNQFGQITGVTTQAVSGGGSATPTNVQVFTSSGTWTKPAGAKAVRVRLLGGGGGGGSGRRGAAASNRNGGGGGAGGGFHEISFDAATLGATETVTVGAGGSGGLGAATDNTNGSNGALGNASSFGAWVTVQGGGLGGGGLAGSPFAAVGGLQGHFGGLASNVGGAGNAGSPTSLQPSGVSTAAYTAATFQGPGGAGGGAGGGISGSDAISNGAAGGVSLLANLSGPSGGTGAGGNGGAGTTPATQAICGTGGGGGASSTVGAAGFGGVGGRASGGGGGGASLNGFASGAGGNGGDGVVLVITYF
jgi:hypothetical protein